MHHARATLKASGYRLTPQRTAIWDVLRERLRHMTADEIAAAVRQRLPDVNTSTVYRTLELLVSLDLVTETKLGLEQELLRGVADPSHHHFVCERCGAVGHFGDQLFAPLYESLAAVRGLRREPRPGDRVRPVPATCRKRRRTVHIPDGYLGPETVAAGWAACAPAWYWADRRRQQGAHASRSRCRCSPPAPPSAFSS